MRGTEKTGVVVHGHRCVSLKVSRYPALDVELVPSELVALSQLAEVCPQCGVH